MSIMRNELKVGRLEVQMEEINRRFNSLESTIEHKFAEVFKRFDEMEARYEARYVRKESFLFYQIILGAIGMAVLSYGISIALPNIFRQ